MCFFSVCAYDNKSKFLFFNANSIPFPIINKNLLVIRAFFDLKKGFKSVLSIG